MMMLFFPPPRVFFPTARFICATVSSPDAIAVLHTHEAEHQATPTAGR